MNEIKVIALISNIIGTQSFVCRLFKLRLYNITRRQNPRIKLVRIPFPLSPSRGCCSPPLSARDTAACAQWCCAASRICRVLLDTVFAEKTHTENRIGWQVH